MTSREYRQLLEKSLTRLGAIRAEREELDVESAKLRQFIQATVRMLDDDDRNAFLKWYRDSIAANDMRSEGLTDAIRYILQDSPKEWFSAAAMRDRLNADSFDFSGYASNPLASVSTTLSRLYPKEADRTMFENVAAYRWKNTKANRLRAKKRRDAAIQAYYGTMITGLLGDDSELEDVPEHLKNGAEDKTKS